MFVADRKMSIVFKVNLTSMLVDENHSRRNRSEFPMTREGMKI